MKERFFFFFLIALLIALLIAGCAVKDENLPDAVSAATKRKGPPARVLLQRIMPGAAADGVVKIAVLVNQNAGDNTRQFIDGCVSEGRALGFTVDAFVSGGDEARCRELAAGIARADYDGLIFAYGDVDFSYDILKPAADAGIQIVTFEALPFRDGRSIDGLIATFQDDYSLARLSLETLAAAGRSPANVIRIACDSEVTFLDRRAWEFDEFVKEGKIVPAARISLRGLENPRAAAREALAAILPRLPVGTVDALWAPWDEFAVGCAEALASAGRHDIKIFSIGISRETIRQMQRYSDFWLANTAIDPQLTGTVIMRMLAAKFAGEEIENTFSFEPQLVKAEDLNPTVNMANISVIIPDWGDGQGLFDRYSWMDELKEAEKKYLRIPPVVVPETSQ
jgi:simple sugar transport system substrate-binding protein